MQQPVVRYRVVFLPWSEAQQIIPGGSGRARRTNVSRASRALMAATRRHSCRPYPPTHHLINMYRCETDDYLRLFAVLAMVMASFRRSALVCVVVDCRECLWLPLRGSIPDAPMIYFHTSRLYIYENEFDILNVLVNLKTKNKYLLKFFA